MGSDRGDKPKKSWRELDAIRDRGGPREARDRLGSPSDRPSERSSKQHRAALEALFEKGGVARIAEKIEERAGPAPGTPPSRAASAHRVDAPPVDAAAAAANDGRAALRKKIVDAIGRDEITRAVDRYLKEHPLPEEFEVLEQAIEHRKPARLEEALAALGRLLDREKPKRTRVLAAKLRLIEETADDKAVRETAARLRARLG